MSDLNMFIPLTKVDAEKRLVYGVATAEAPDRSKEICDYESTKPHYEAWSGSMSKASDGKSLGNLRVMHGKVAAGKIVDISYDDENKRIMVCAKVVDDNEWRKVQEGVYTGFSQGGSYLKRWEDPDKPGYKRYTAKPSEISLVDIPCLPTATFEYIKANGAESELRKFTTVEKYDDSEAHDERGRWTGTGQAALLGAASGAVLGGVVGGTVASGKGGKIGAAVGAVLTAAAVKTTHGMNDPNSEFNRMMDMFQQVDHLESKGFDFDEDFKRFRYNGKTYRTNTAEGQALVAQHTKAMDIVDLAKFADRADDLLDTAEMLSLLKTGSPDSWPELLDLAEEVLTKYSDSQERDEKGRWRAISSAALNVASAAAGGALTGSIMGRGVAGAIGGAITGAVHQAYREATESKEISAKHAALGGAFVGSIGGIAGGAVGSAVANVKGRANIAAGEAAFAESAKIARESQQKTAAAIEILHADVSFAAASAQQLKDAGKLFTDWHKNRYKKMDATDLDLRKAVWDELLELRKSVVVLDTLVDMAATLGAAVTDEEVEELVLGKYSDSEPRDDDGKWTSGGGGSGRNNESAAMRAIRGATAGAVSGLVGSVPSAAVATLVGGPAAGVASVVKDTVTGAVVGAAAGAVSNSDKVEVNAVRATDAVGLAQNVVGGYRFLRSFVTSPRTRQATMNSLNQARAAAPGVFRAASRVASAADRASSAVGNAAYSAADAVISGASRLARHTKMDLVGDHLVTLAKYGVNIAEIVSAIAEEEDMSGITNQQVQEKAAELAKAAGDGSHWAEHIATARETLEKAASGASAAAGGSASLDSTSTTECQKADPSSPVTDPDDKGVWQGWVAKDGSVHAKKADAVAKNVELADSGAPLKKLLSDTIAIAEGKEIVQNEGRFAELKKYIGEEVWDAQRAIEALNTVFGLLAKEISEVEKAPEQVAGLQKAVDGLKEFIASEILEDNSDDIGKIADALGTLAKSGARNSKSDLDRLQQIHDHVNALGASCGSAEKSVQTEDLAKALAERDALQKSMSEFETGLTRVHELVKAQADRIKKLEAMPGPTPNLRIVNKGMDVTISGPSDVAEVLSKMAPEDAAQVMIRAAQKQPRSTI